MASKKQRANIAAAIQQSGATPPVTSQGTMTLPNADGMSIFVPNRDAVATPPPIRKAKKKVKLSNEQNIYMAKKKVGSFTLNTITVILILGLCFVILYPFLQLVPTVLANLNDLGNPNIIWIPEEFSTTSFEMASYFVMKQGPMTLVSSIGYALAIMAIQVFVSAMTGYTMARVNYKWGSAVLFIMVVLSFLVPMVFHGFYDATCMIQNDITIWLFLIFLVFMYILVFRLLRQASKFDRPVV